MAEKPAERLGTNQRRGIPPRSAITHRRFLVRGEHGIAERKPHRPADTVEQLEIDLLLTVEDLRHLRARNANRVCYLLMSQFRDRRLSAQKPGERFNERTRRLLGSSWHDLMFAQKWNQFGEM